MIINLHDKAAYYHAPKCGSRTILAWGCLIKNPNLIEENPKWFSDSKLDEYNEIRKLLSLFSKTRQDWGKDEVQAVESDYRFCVIRNPVERFVSGFTNRVLFHKNLAGDLSIQEFIDNFDFICRINRNIENHFRQQWYFYGDLDKFHRVYKMNEFSQIKLDLENLFGAKLPNLQLQQNGSYKKPELTQEQIKWVKNKYSLDYEKYERYF
jgi:hypothetical protein